MAAMVLAMPGCHGYPLPWLDGCHGWTAAMAAKARVGCHGYFPGQLSTTASAASGSTAARSQGWRKSQRRRQAQQLSGLLLLLGIRSASLGFSKCGRSCLRRLRLDGCLLRAGIPQGDFELFGDLDDLWI